MAKKKATSDTNNSSPRFPYTTVPNSLRKFLKLIPEKPRPTNVTANLLHSWGLTSSNDRSVVSVLKDIKLLGSSGEPTQDYEAFMHPSGGASAIGVRIKEIYAPLFQASHRPDQDGGDTLRRLFNLHSGGSEKTLNLQIQTFKALCEFASFDNSTGGGVNPTAGASTSNGTGNGGGQGGTGASPTIHIDLHIHLPENKTTRDYEAIIQDIARYIYKQEVAPNG